MLTFYVLQNEVITPIPRENVKACISQLIWVDLLCPTHEEEVFVENLLPTSIPTRDEMVEIELSNRLYKKNGAVYATATMVTKADTPEPETHAITFVLSGEHLITVRYSDPQSFRTFLGRSSIIRAETYHGNTVLAGLMEAIIDRIADILENVGHHLDDMTKKIFRPHLEDAKARSKKKPQLEEMLRQAGIKGDLVSKIRESLVSINRLLGFISQTSYFNAGSEEHNRLQTAMKDIQALNDHASFISNKVNFLLDATLGMISIEQNGIIKIFSVAAVVFLPPTLVASIYGMNFDAIPELHWHFGYPFAIGTMILSALLPYKFFRWKGWL
ncbi:MAG: Magnesium/cobalt transport protein [Rickettsiales bacterium]|jgi:magnesium transporter|nr:Magnesium/cobalt transport protein [Rickettsiales bacterium]